MKQKSLPTSITAFLQPTQINAIECGAKLLTGLMAELHNDGFRYFIDHQVGLVVIRPDIASERRAAKGGVA